MKIRLYFLIFLSAPCILFSQTGNTSFDNRIRHIVEVPTYFDSDECTNLEGKAQLKCAEKEMLKFVYARLEYPESAKANRVEGTVVIKFIVEKDGTLNQFEIERNLEEGCGKAALEAVKTIERFVPAQLKGEAVSVYYKLSVKFDLSKQ